MNDDVELSETERRALERLSRDIAPPAAVEDRVVTDLRARGLVRSPRAGSGWLRSLAAAAVIVAAFAGGTEWHRLTSVRPIDASPRYVLLLYGGEDSKSPSRHAEYAAWAQSADRSGAVISGEELTGAVGALPAPAAASAVPPPEAPAGFFIVSAPTLDDARRIAETCPHLQHGGRIVVRSIAAGPASGR